MSTQLEERLRVLGAHLDYERHAATRHSPTVHVVPDRHAPRRRTFAAVAAVAVIVIGLAATVTLRGTDVEPAQSPVENGRPSLYDGGVAIIVLVDVSATESQIAFIRDTVSSRPDLIDSTRVDYYDEEQTRIELQRVVTNPAQLEPYLLPHAVPTMFKLYATPTADPSQLADLAIQFNQLPSVVGAQTARSPSLLPPMISTP